VIVRPAPPLPASLFFGGIVKVKRLKQLLDGFADELEVKVSLKSDSAQYVDLEITSVYETDLPHEGQRVWFDVERSNG
jgi:hypothetical protein